MIAAIEWIPAGRANPTPSKYEYSRAEQAFLEKVQAGEHEENEEENEEENDDDDDDEEWEDVVDEESEEQQQQQQQVEVPSVDPESLPADLRMDDYSDDDEEGGDKVGGLLVGKVRLFFSVFQSRLYIERLLFCDIMFAYIIIIIIISFSKTCGHAS